MRKGGVSAIAVLSVIPILFGMALLAQVAQAGGSPPRRTTAAGRDRHVFLIVLENHGLNTVLRETTYLGQVLPQQYYYATNYYGVGHHSLDNYIAMVSGQEPNCLTRWDCSVPHNLSADYEACVYPPRYRNLADQLDERKLSWKAYMEGMETNCQLIESLSSSFEGYAIRHNPFIFFRDIVNFSDILNRHRPDFAGITDGHDRCATNVVPYSELEKDMLGGDDGRSRVPNFSFIVPDTCHDAHNDWLPRCSLEAADKWLEREVPKIIGNDKVFREHDVLFITFDESEMNDCSGCCDSGFQKSGTGGGRVILVAVTKDKPGSHELRTRYNHYSLLRTIEDIFGITEHLGHASEVDSISELTHNPEAPARKTPARDLYDPLRCTADSVLPSCRP